MGIIYLVALTLGLGTLTLQFVLSHIGGADADGDADADVDELHLDVGADELALDGDVDHEIEVGDHDASMVGSAAGVFLSMRFWTFALMAFGMVGSLLHYLHLSGFPLGLALSLLSGLASGLTAGLTFRALKGAVSSTTSQDDTVGKMAKVTVPLRKGSVGKVRVQIKGRRVDLLATTDSEVVGMGDEVVVLEFRDGQAVVEPLGKSETR